jgi:hypothetical protein
MLPVLFSLPLAFSCPPQLWHVASSSSTLLHLDIAVGAGSCPIGWLRGTGCAIDGGCCVGWGKVMAAGGGRPRWGVDICCEICVVDFGAGSGGRDLFVVGIEGNAGPVVATAGEKREVEGGVGGV